MKKLICLLVLTCASCLCAPAAEDKAATNDQEFQEKLRSFSGELEESEKHRPARELLRLRRFSSQQVKTIALSLRDDAARLEFATLAYPRTVDPENFYEVYDAFTSFSKVMRLHDRIRQSERPATPVVALPRTVSDNEFRDILKSIRRENFDNTRMQLARQILTSSRSLFLSSQIRQIVECFDFEPGKLELAKLAYEYTFDRERYFLVNEAFDFDGTRQTLAKYIETWNREHHVQH